MNKLLYLTILILAIAFVFFCCEISPPVRNAVVVSVIDGDTIIARFDGKMKVIRILGVDTPEEGQAGYENAYERTTELLLGNEIKTDCWKKDKYDRDLCWVFYEGQDVAEILILEGLGDRVEPY